MPKKAKSKAVKRGGRKATPAKRKKVVKRAARSRSGLLYDCIEGAGGLLAKAGQAGLTALARKITGFGDYKISSNSLVGAGSSYIPEFGGDSIRITRKEYLGDVSSSTQFSLTAYSINPGDSVTFPWLSILAQNFEEYELHGLVFSFISTSAVALTSADPALGKVLMATEYNVDAPYFTNSRSMLATIFSNYGKPASDLMHAVECKRSDKLTRSLLIRKAGQLPSGATAQFYDLGNFQFATEGMQSASNIGGLWVTYDITLRKPILSEVLGEPEMSKLYIGDFDLFKDGDLKAAEANFSNNLGVVFTYNTSNYNIVCTLPQDMTGMIIEVMAQFRTSGSPTATGAGSGYTMTASGLNELKYYFGSAASNVKSTGTPTNTFNIMTTYVVTADGTERGVVEIPTANLPEAYTEIEVTITVRTTIVNYVNSSTFLYDSPMLVAGVKERKKRELVT